MTNYREHLAPYENQYVAASGIYETASEGHMPHNRTVLITDCMVEGNDGKRLHVQHSWIQYAGEIIHERPQKGDKIYFDCVINKYPKKDGDGIVDAWGLAKPCNVRLEPRDEPYRSPYLPPPIVPAKVEPMPKPPEEKPSPAKVLKAVKELTMVVAPADWLKQVAPHMEAIAATVKLCGGVENFVEILEFLGDK